MRLFGRKDPLPPVEWLVVGLGNPGPEYAQTRHNVGFRVIDLLAGRAGVAVKRLESRAQVGTGSIGERAALLVKPITYMNLCGESVGPLAGKVGVPPERVLVVSDDVDLPIGRLRLRPSGSAGGHNGLKSLIQHLRTNEFPRIRLGVGRPGERGETADHVLGKFSRAEEEIVREAVERAADAVELVLREGLAASMNRFNRSEPPPAQ